MASFGGFKVGIGIAIAALAGSQQALAQAPALSVDRLPRLGTIDARFSTRMVTTAGATAFTTLAYEPPGIGLDTGVEIDGDEAAMAEARGD